MVKKLRLHGDRITLLASAGVAPIEVGEGVELDVWGVVSASVTRPSSYRPRPRQRPDGWTAGPVPPISLAIMDIGSGKHNYAFSYLDA